MARRLYVLLNPQDVRGRENPDREAAHCRAANAWMADTWLGCYNASGIYRGPLGVCVTDPSLAVARDRALGRASRFVQVLVDPATATPLDDPIYNLVYEAATRNLPVAAHLVSGAGRALLTPAAYKHAGQRGVALDLADPDAEASLGRLADSADLILIAPSASVSAGTGPAGATRRVGRPPGRRSAASPGLAHAVPKTARAQPT